MTTIRRGLPGPGPDQALGRGLRVLTGGRAGDVGACAEARPPDPAAAPGRPANAAVAALGAALARPAAAVEADAMRRRVAELEAEVDNLRRELRIARADHADELAALQGRHEVAVTTAVLDAERRLLGVRRKTVAGHTMPSILGEG